MPSEMGKAAVCGEEDKYQELTVQNYNGRSAGN